MGDAAHQQGEVGRCAGSFAVTPAVIAPINSRRFCSVGLPAKTHRGLGSWLPS